ncbi:MAG: PEP-CTERM system TPR-repeat protein PrsT [Gammaproteobacteria bacterium]|uniref:XrtA/PEP-CTERM system TPR-repeat protein PrsT n=1 Tax=Rhodoferax sp. TaxID=50421 RepID=UPI0018164969|nr:XrtA/PEP-CTERM system TPR-repeat protein PrsT [Rhodoferax sp.]MBU3897523.1 PEP-CTERM system TPR-repeat protein PrsT [Gammaproteobacteria bacterium]MBA3058030.1 PEP-CTERM system TPR-repeat protein PrsT [Rhodoferax sp.]MBU3999362.1 PEP-CTERM system TPR-repeat protein PrsT [Gammaproteobacteria bacterium]MBU4018869.1 PEP-CTERM system TPR-repeat protein PrsT [Gammaproteobacteria bacterium]MBU4079824.1 PEP-CTERM system TPR-repeat protein PrsT [Gammaproteobacteria bacterium]
MKFKTTTARIAVTLLLASLLAACNDKPELMLSSAKDYLAKNDSKAAVIQIKNALQSNPDLPEARYLLGTALLDSGDPAGAELELRKALDMKYPQDAVVPKLAKALLAQGHARKVTEEFAKTDIVEPSAKASLQVSLTSAYALQGKTEQSQASLNAALLADPGFAPALLLQARQKAGQREFDQALAMTEEVLVKSPASTEAWMFKGDLLMYAKSQPEQAMAAYRKALEIKPDFMPAQVSVITLLLQQSKLLDAAQQIEHLKKTAARHPQTQFLEAQLAYQKKDFKLARQIMLPVLQLVPNSAQALQLSGLVELQLNAWPAAQDYLSRVLQAAPNSTLARRALVVSYVRAGQAAEALKALLPGLNRDNVDPDLLSVAGEVYLLNGDLQKAQEYFAKAARQSPQDGRKRTSLALTRLMGGATEAGFDELQKIADSDTGTSADLALISAHLKRREFDAALKAIDALEKKQPDKPFAAQLRARTLLAKGDVNGARKSFERALALDPHYFPAVASLAGLDFAEKKPEVAKKRFEAVLTQDPKSGQAWLALAELASRTGATKDETAKLISNAVTANPTDVKSRLLLIDFNLRQQDVKAAVAAAQDGAVALPDSPELLDALGRTQQAAGELNQAIATYTKLVALQPLSALPHMRLADAHLAGKNKEAALASLHRALETKPDLLEAQRALIALMLDSKKPQDALTLARAVQQQRPQEAVGYSLEGDIHAAQKDWVNSTAAYRSGLKRVIAPELAVRLHAVLGMADQGAEASKFASSWQREHPKDAVFQLYLGDTALSRKDYASAEKHYAAVVSLQPNSAMAYNNLAWVSAKLNREGAIGFAEKANALAPNQPAFMDTLALLLSDKGEYAKALALQNQALALQPQNALFKLNLAKIHLKAGAKEQARKELAELDKLGDKFGGQTEVASLLKNL